MHWRYQLNEWVVDHLDRMGQMEDSEILRRNNLSQKRKTRNAIEIIKQMVEAGEIEKLWRDFHIALKSAREKTVRLALRMTFGYVTKFIVFILVYLGMSTDLLHHYPIAAFTIPSTFTMIPHFMNSTVVAPLYILTRSVIWQWNASWMCLKAYGMN